MPTLNTHQARVGRPLHNSLPNAFFDRGRAAS